MTFEEFTKVLDLLCDGLYLNPERDKPRGNGLTILFSELEKFSYEHFKLAVFKILKEHEYNYFPKLATFLKALSTISPPIHFSKPVPCSTCDSTGTLTFYEVESLAPEQFPCGDCNNFSTPSTLHKPRTSSPPPGYKRKSEVTLDDYSHALLYREDQAEHFRKQFQLNSLADAILRLPPPQEFGLTFIENIMMVNGVKVKV